MSVAHHAGMVPRLVISILATLAMCAVAACASGYADAAVCRQDGSGRSHFYRDFYDGYRAMGRTLARIDEAKTAQNLGEAALSGTVLCEQVTGLYRLADRLRTQRRHQYLEDVARLRSVTISIRNAALMGNIGELARAIDDLHDTYFRVTRDVPKRWLRVQSTWHGRGQPGDPLKFDE